MERMEEEISEIKEAAVVIAEAALDEVEGLAVDAVIDIEETVKSGRRPPLARSYVIRVDKHRFTVHGHKITGREILTTAGKLPPEGFILREVFAGGRSIVVELNQTIDLRENCVEKFKTLPRDQTEG